MNSTAVLAKSEIKELSTKRRCFDCGGFPIAKGSVFFPIAVHLKGSGARSGEATAGAICECCLLKRLVRRLDFHDGTCGNGPSGRFYKIDKTGAVRKELISLFNAGPETSDTK